MALCQSCEESKSVHLSYGSQRQISPGKRCRSPKLDKTEEKNAYWVDVNKYICRKCGYIHEVVKSRPNNEIKNQEYSKRRVVGSHEDSKAVKASQPYFNDQDTESVADNFDYLKNALGNHSSMGASTKELRNQRSQFTLQDRDVYDRMLNIKYNLSYLDPHDSVSARPDIYSVWRGCFRIKNGKHETTMRLVAHMSSKACSEILYTTCALEPEIDVTILPKSDAWLKSFRKSRPEDCDIGLYFFPEGGRDEKVYFWVLDEMIRQEFALKAMIQDWELRVLYSRELPMKHWRVQQQYYMWGSFRT